MRRSERAAQARRSLDQKFATADLGAISARPRGGWIRAVRAGLGMSQEALARRLGVSPPNVAKLERSEVHDTISIGKLAEVADALDCRLVYAIVPRESLEATVQDRARQVAASTLGYVDATMHLEDQDVRGRQRAEQVALHAARIIDANRQWRTL